MAHGTPDWGGSAPRSRTYRLSDHGELAARMGSIVTYDRRGEILWMENFSLGGQSYNCDGIGIGEGYYLTCAGVCSGGLSLVLQTGAAPLDYERIYRYGYCPFVGGIGEELWFHAPANLSYLTLQMLIYYETERHDYRVKYDDNTGEVSVYDATGVWVKIGDTWGVGGMAGAYIPLKMVINLDTHRYARVMIMERAFTPVGYGPLVTPGAASPCMFSEARVYAWLAGGLEVHIDNWIMTQNEPVT